MAERQFFGFKFQDEYCKLHNLTNNKNYTSFFDAKDNNGLNYQIKTYKDKSELMMANPFRYLENKEDFILIIANRDENNNILSTKKVFIDNVSFKQFLIKQNFTERINYCQNVLNSVTNNYCDDEKFKNLMKKEKGARKNSIINIQAKRDHKSQKRVQWSIPNRYIDKFISLFKEI